MKVIKMAKICHSCQFYRSISYANGESSIGCLKAAGADGRPVDIRNIDVCPLGYAKRKTQILNPQEVLNALGKIYAKTAPSDAYVSLYKLLSETSESLHRRRMEISMSLQQLDILKVVAKTVPGQRGRHYIYRWNMKKHGPPSLEMADRVIMQVEQFINAEALALKRARTENVEEKKVFTVKVYEGVTDCKTCWLKGLKDCRTQLMSFGIDCKGMNMNTMKHEAGLGFKKEQIEG